MSTKSLKGKIRGSRSGRVDVALTCKFNVDRPSSTSFAMDVSLDGLVMASPRCSITSGGRFLVLTRRRCNLEEIVSATKYETGQTLYFSPYEPRIGQVQLGLQPTSGQTAQIMLDRGTWHLTLVKG